jgi:hypothetical protein
VIVDLGANNAALSDTEVTLTGGAKDTSDYIDLPDGVLSSLGDSATIEVWATQESVQNWSRIWDFGSSTTHNVFMSWTVATTLTNDRVEWVGPNGTVTQDGTNAPYTLGAEFHIVCVFQPGSVTWYSAPANAADLGAAQGSLQTSNVLSTLQDTNAWIGRSQWPDNTASARFNEFRLWKGAMTQADLEKLHDMGPDRVVAGIATVPVPTNTVTDVPRDTTLSWQPGDYAATHDVYLGKSPADVAAATTSAPLDVLVSQGQNANSFDPGRLEFGQTYYWRVDEVNAAPDATVFKGDVWSFTVEPFSYPIAGVVATASGSSKASMGPEKTVDGSGLNELDQHGTDSTDSWLSAKGDSAWIRFTFDGLYKLDKALVWNCNQALEDILGVSSKDVKVEYSADGETWTALGDFVFARAPGAEGYTADTILDFAGVAAKAVQFTIASNWGETFPQYGLSEVRFYSIPAAAREPSPADDANDVHPQVVLSWRAGREAASHKAYIGEDEQAVAEGTAPIVTVDSPEYETSLKLDGIYYWKVAEVNDAEATPSWDSPVWTFDTAHFIVVDDFESYTDDMTTGGAIFQSWIDGYEDAANGSLVGYINPPFAEQSVVHSGKQSMPMAYDNTGGVTYSEATLSFNPAQDWTQHGVTTLVLYFRGLAINAAAPLYVKINDKKVPFNNGATATTMPVWKQWNIPLAGIGAGLKNVKSLTVGVEGSGAGTMFFDDIRLYAAAPEAVVPVDPGTTGLAALYAMDGNVQDSSGKKQDGTLNGDASYEAGYLGQALFFSGVNTYVDLPIGTLLSTLNNITVTTWVNSSGAGGDWQRIFDFGTGTTNYMFLSSHQTATGPMTFGIRTTTSTETRVVAPARLPAGWHHVAIDIDSATMTAKLYLDGVVVGANTVTVLPKDLGNPTQNWLGRSQWTADAYFSGSLDEFRIYNRVLSEAEVRYLAGDR